MASVVKTYIVVSSLPVVIEDAGVALSYQPGALFQAKSNNPSVLNLLEDGRIVESTGQVDQGFAVIQGQQGPVGPAGPTGPQGPPGGLPAALTIDNATSGFDIQITDGDAIVAQTDGGWDLGSPDGGSTLLRPQIVYVQNSVVVDGSSLTSTSLNAAGTYTVESGADSDLFITAGDATPASNNDGGDLILTAGSEDGSGAKGKIELRGNFTNSPAMDVDDGVVGFWDAANKTVRVFGDPGAIRVGRNSQLTLAEGDAVFGNDGTISGTQTGLMLWEAGAQQLAIRDNADQRMIELDGAANEVAIYEGTGIRGLKATTAGGTATLKAEDSADRTGVDTVLDLLIQGGTADGVENGGSLTLDAGRALGTGLDGQLLFRTGNMDRWFIDANGQLLASTDNGYNIGAVGANRPLRVYVGTEVVVGNTVTIATDSITANGALTMSVTGAFNASSPASTAGPGAAWAWTLQEGEGGIAGVIPVPGSAGGGWTITGGAGGVSQGTDVGGETGGDAGSGGTLQLVGGPGGAADAGTVDPGQPAAGGLLQLFGGPGGAGTGTSDNANGGNVVIRGGPAGTGGSGVAGTAGSVVIGDSDTLSIVCGSNTVSTTSVVGSVTTIDGGVSIDFETGGAAKWQMDTTGHLLAQADNSYDIGATGANRPRNVFVGTDVEVGLGTGYGALIQSNATSKWLLADTTALYTGENATGVGINGSNVDIQSGDGGPSGDAWGGFVCIFPGIASADATGNESVYIQGGYTGRDGEVSAQSATPGGVYVEGGRIRTAVTSGSCHGGSVEIRATDANVIGAGTPVLDGGNVVIAAGKQLNGGTDGRILFHHGNAGGGGQGDLTGLPIGAISDAGWEISTGVNLGFFGTTPVAQQADTVALTDSTGGAANDTLVAVAGSGADAAINDNFADLAAKYNALRDLLRAYGLMA